MYLIVLNNAEHNDWLLEVIELSVAHTNTMIAGEPTCYLCSKTATADWGVSEWVKRLSFDRSFIQLVQTNTVDGRTQSWREPPALTSLHTHISMATHGPAFTSPYTVTTGNHNWAQYHIFFQSQAETINQLTYQLHSYTTWPLDPSLVQYFP